MKNNRKLHKLIFNISMVFVLIIGLSLPTPVSHTALAEEEEDDESGFLVEVDKVDGQTDIFDLILDQELNMDEGELTGVTIIQESVAADGRTLIVKIHSEGPVPVENLIGDVEEVVELDVAGGQCAPSQAHWTCFEDVVLLLSYQAVDTISLPDSTVEVCFEGECAGAGDADGMNMDIDDIELEDMDMNSLNELVDTVDEMVDDAQGLQQAIDDEGQVSAVKQRLDEAEDAVGQPDMLPDLAAGINGAHEILDENVTDLGIMTANADDTLKQVSNQVDLYAERIEQEEEEWSEEWGIEPEEFEAYLDELDTDEVDEEELPDVDISEWKEEISNLQERMSDTYGNVEGLNEQRQEFTKELEDFHAGAHELAGAVEEADGYSDDQLDDVRKDLDVAEPGKTVEKQMFQVNQALEEPASLDESEKIEELTEEATEGLEASGMSVELAEDIGQRSEEMDESMADVLEEAEQDMDRQSEQMDTIDSRLSELSEQIRVPEQLAEEYELNFLPEEEQNGYRVNMQGNITNWEEQFEQLLENMNNHDLQNALQTEYEDIQQQLAALRADVQEMEEEFSEEELNAIMENLEGEGGEAFDEEREEWEAQLEEALQRGDEHAQVVQAILEDANAEIDDMKALSAELSEQFLGMDSLNDEEADQFEDYLLHLHEQMDAMVEPAIELQNEIAIAEDLQEALDTNSEELEQLKDTIAEVDALRDDLEDLQDNLNELSFTRTNEFIEEIQNISENIADWFE
ncbi:hypothetical protein HUG15_02620 [Salicibibacter cibarius]|uniref:Uncharacterized protein n=1 Tax=Salicibibacter cibarius TaxID=2743000 RepID=A0A7T6Z0I9_9BACI|nr:hypothetical protein [Salicibibacter cibarius]QQK74602.1 hypothetical protein HUG15_02620 [Salicibibacter cibarius]